MSCHLYPGVQELVKVLTELSGGYSQLAAGASGGMDHVPSGVVELSCRVVQAGLGLLEGLTAGRELSRVETHVTQL